MPPRPVGVTRRPPRWQRVLLVTLATLALLVALARWALDWDVTRRFIAERITGALHGAIAGASLEVVRIEHLGWGELSGGELLLRDASGVERGRAVDVAATFAVWPLLSSLLLGLDPIEIPFRTTHVGRVDVDLEWHEDEIMIGGPAAQVPPKPGQGPGRGFRLSLDVLRIDAGSIDVATDAGSLTTSLHDLEGGLELSSSELVVTLNAAPLSVSSPLGSIRVYGFGRVRRHLTRQETEGDILVLANLPDAAMATTISWHGGGWVVVTATDIPHDSLSELVPSWPEPARGALLARFESDAGTSPEGLEIYVRAGLETGELTFEGAFDPAARRLFGALALSESNAARWWRGAEDVSLAMSATLDASTEPPQASLRIDDLTVAVDDTTARGVSGSAFADATGATAAVVWPASGVTAAGRYDHARQLVDARLALDTRGRAFWRETAHWVVGAQATAEATIDLRSRRVAAQAHASARRIAAAGAAAHRVRIDGRATGPLTAPRIALEGSAARVSRGGLGGALTVRAAGRLPDFDASLTLSGDRHGELAAETRAHCATGVCDLADLTVQLARAGRRITAHARHITLRREQVSLDGATIHGLGAPVRVEGSFSAEGQRLSIDATAVAVSKVGWWLRRPRPWRGTMSAEVALELAPTAAFGRVSGALRDVVIGAAPPVDAELELDVDGSRVEGRLTARAASSHARLALDDVNLAGGLFDGTAWLGATGTAEAELYTSRALLSAVSTSIGAPMLVLLSDRLEGVAARASVRRPSTAEPPAIDALWQATSTGHLSPSGTWEPGCPYTARGFVETTRRGATATLAASASVAWQRTRLLAAAGEIDLPLSALQSSEAWKRAPWRASVWVPPRAVSTLPYASDLAGRVEALANLGGTALEPILSVAVDASALRVAGHDFGGVSLTARHAGGKASLMAIGRERGTIRGVGHLDLDVSLADVATPDAWRGDAHLSLLGWPLRVEDADRGLDAAARLSGQVAWLDLGATPKLAAQLAVTDLVVGDERFIGAIVSATIDEHAAHLDATLEQTARSSGKLSVRAARARGASWLPRLEPPLSARLEARELRLSAIAPLLTSMVRSLDGRLNADAWLEVDHDRTTARGVVAIDDGQAQLRGLSTPWRDVTLRARFAEDEIVVDTLAAKSWGGMLTAKAAVMLENGRFARAEGEILVPNGAPIPLIVDGNRVADVSGKLALAADGARRPIAVRVRASDVEVQLPALASKDLQSLDADPHIRIIGAPRRREDGHEHSATPSSMPTLATLDVRTTDDVVVTQGENLRATLAGGATITVSGSPTIRGRLRLEGGHVEVQGKRFNIDEGKIIFRPEAPSDPYLEATASWLADDGTVVYADYVGPLSAGEVSLRSDPPLSRGQVLATLILGSAERPTNQYTGTAAAAGLGGGIAADPLNTVLRKVSRLDITAGVETGLAAAPAPAIEWRIARELSIRFAHVLGLPVPGENPDRNLTTLTWRFFRRWSLEATIGDRGSSILDLFWQTSY